MARLPAAAVAKLSREDAQRYFDNWAADLKARLKLIDLAERIYEGPGDAETNAAVASLWHAADYLHDRIGYEMAPHPKGMIRMPEGFDA